MTITFTVGSSATENVYSNINTTITTLSNVQSRVDIRGTVGPAPGTVIDRNKISLCSPGQVYIRQQSTVRGIMAYAAQSQLVNTAVLTNSAVSSSITILSCILCPRTITTGACTATCSSASGATCTSSNSSVIGVSSCTAQLTGTETGGASSVNVMVSLSGSMTNVTFVVWWPSRPVSIGLTSNMLSPVTGWLDASSSCRQVYQSTQLAVQALFI